VGRAAGGAGVLPGRQHARLHPPAQQLHGPQTVESHDGFSDKQGGFAFPLLSDQDKQVGREYGILGPVGFYRRSIFVVDATGIVRYVHRAVAGLSFRPTDEVVAAVAAARTS
jgi:thioredoxin-dependent peroxiredoxin